MKRYFLSALILCANHSHSKDSKHEENKHAAPTQDKSSKAQPSQNVAAHNSEVGVPAATALQWLKNGNTRYLKNNVRSDGQSSHDRERLSKGQKPHTIILSCADSRVPPEIVFDQKLGEIFVVRSAGEALDSAVIASLEYAAEHLGSKLLVVMGHSACGAVKASIDTMKTQNAGSLHLNRLVADIQPRIKASLGASNSPGLIKESTANAQGVVKDLMDRSQIIKHLVDNGTLKIVSGLYNLENGTVTFNE